MARNIDFRANGKLLISGEYLVLAGAKALALPLKFGQQIHIKEISDQVIRWTSSQPEGIWFSCELDPFEFNVLTSENPVSSKLSALVKATQQLTPSFHNSRTGLTVNVEANYPVKWGLGSSSTLISLIAQWAGINPFTLFRTVSEGSGYDIACADHSKMIFYQLNGNEPEITETKPGPALSEFSYFVSLGNKQDTRKEVNSFLKNNRISPGDIDMISHLSVQICNARNYDDLVLFVREHESILERILGRKLLNERFKEFPGTVKSLGAWGGDFAMFVTDLDPVSARKELTKSGLTDVFTFDEIKADQ